tara:strand:+ start:535 stop:720 length:186 start_codon:yes stop_codon:yes gene_type:complete
LKAKLEKIRSANDEIKKAKAKIVDFLTIINKYTADPKIPKLDRKTMKLKSMNIMNRHWLPC